MSKDTLVVMHLEGTGLVSSWLKDLVLPPESGTEYLYRGNLFKVAQSLHYLPDHHQVMGGNITGYLQSIALGFAYQFNRACSGYGTEVDP